MASPLLGIAAVNSLLFASYAASKRVMSPFPELSIQEIVLVGGMAGFANAVLASPEGKLVYVRKDANMHNNTCLIHVKLLRYQAGHWVSWWHYWKVVGTWTVLASPALFSDPMFSLPEWYLDSIWIVWT
ncbi:hypothetical protein BS17DRAFT_786740 [Gyrodon lividus]|nr:hypothetical protein BS17DRAFT_786740 [Gyrodon lividus]